MREDGGPAVRQGGKEEGPNHHPASSISDQSRSALSAFVSTSVATKTSRVYEGHWAAWTKFVCEETQTSDPFLSWMDEQEKASMVGLMLARKHQAGQLLAHAQVKLVDIGRKAAVALDHTTLGLAQLGVGLHHLPEARFVRRTAGKHDLTRA